MNWLRRFFGRVAKVVAPKEDVYELVHMKANDRWYATVNGQPLKWDVITGQYKPAYSWDYATSSREKFWAQHMVDHHREWKNKEILTKERV